MTNTTDSASILGLFNLGNGLIEVAALTSLVGSAAAQSLALGDKGPAGLVWATMTIFSAMSARQRWCPEREIGCSCWVGT